VLYETGCRTPQHDRKELQGSGSGPVLLLSDYSSIGCMRNSTLSDIDIRGSAPALLALRVTSSAPGPHTERSATMDTVNIPSETVPAEMKACEQILKRAKELKKPEPVVAYWCE